MCALVTNVFNSIFNNIKLCDQTKKTKKNPTSNLLKKKIIVKFASESSLKTSRKKRKIHCIIHEQLSIVSFVNRKKYNTKK